MSRRSETLPSETANMKSGNEEKRSSVNELKTLMGRDVRVTISDGRVFEGVLRVRVSSSSLAREKKRRDRD